MNRIPIGVTGVVAFVLASLAQGQTGRAAGGPAGPFPTGSRCVTQSPGPGPEGLWSSPLWPDGLVYYSFNANVSPANQQAVLDAMAALEDAANLTFILRTTEPNWIEFRGLALPCGCCAQSSAIGMAGGVQYVQSPPGCAWGVSLMVHEIGHALGLWHEQQRPDRDNYVEIIWANITPGFAGNYAIVNANVSGPYDFSSTMHYDQVGFSSGAATIRVKPPYDRFWQWGMAGAFGVAPYLSIGDRWALRDMYPGGPALPPRQFRILLPASGTLSLPGPSQFTWTAAEGAASYHLEVDDDPLFRNPEIDLTTTELQASPGTAALTPNRLYVWRVTASNAAGETACFPIPFHSFYTAGAYPSFLFVDDSAAVGGDGLSWATALRTPRVVLETAFASSGTVSEIRVAQGVYTPDLGSGDRDQFFEVADGCVVKGGYAGFGTPDPDARDAALYPTILSGDLLGNDGANFTNIADNAYHVVAADRAASPARLDGFTIRGGNADGLGPPAFVGAGLRAGFTEAVISNCTISGNSASFGGGFFVYQSGLQVENCVIRGNRSQVGGGAGVLAPPAPAFVNCLVTGNQAGTGAGIQVDHTSLIVADCTFAQNAASASGGAIQAVNGAALSVFNSVLWGDSAPSGAEISLSGAGIFANGPSSGTAMYSDVAGGSAGIPVQPGNSFAWGAGNIAADPKFVSPGTGNFRLGTGSPCTDGGSNLHVTAGVITDLNGAARFVDYPGAPNTGVPGGAGGPKIVDMGAYERGCYPDCNADGAVTVADFGCFQTAFVTGNMYADCNQSGTLTVQDFGCYQTAFVAGCP